MLAHMAACLHFISLKSLKNIKSLNLKCTLLYELKHYKNTELKNLNSLHAVPYSFWESFVKENVCRFRKSCCIREHFLVLFLFKKKLYMTESLNL